MSLTAEKLEALLLEAPVRPIGGMVLVMSDELGAGVDASEYSKLAESDFVIPETDEKKRRQAGQVWGTLLDMGCVAFTGGNWQRS